MKATGNVWLAAALVLTLGVLCPGAEQNPPGIYVEPQSGLASRGARTLKREAVQKYDQPGMACGSAMEGRP